MPEVQVSQHDSLKAAIRRERILALYRFNRASVVSTMVVAPIIAWASPSSVPREQLIGWVAAMYAISLLRVASSWMFDRAPQEQRGAPKWEFLYILLTLLIGIAWGALALPVIDTPPDMRVLACCVLLGITAFGMFPNMPSVPAFAALTVPILGSMIVGAYLQLVPQADKMILLIAIYLVLILLAARRLSANFTELVGARLEFMRISEAAEAASMAKSQFVANMSHEIRTPLNGVLGMAELLQNTQLGEEQRRYCRAIVTSGRALHGLLTDILDMARIEAGKVELDTADFEPKALAADMAQAYGELARERGNVFDTEIGPGADVRVAGDPKRLRQVLSNLLSNALKFTQDGSVTLSLHKLDPRSGDGRTWLRFSVRDTGIGMSDAVLGKLFQPFVQADGSTTRQYGGSGLGLAICKRLVELMGGSIHIESAPASGARVWFDVPFSAAASPAPVAVAERPAPQRIAARVLVAEDNPVNQEVIKAMLSQFGATVTVVENGALAVEALRQGQFDLVFMDCQMPVMDGYRAAAAIRSAETGKHVPIIALTAHALAEERQRCLDAGMDDYLAKPVTSENLARMSSHWLSVVQQNGDASAGMAPPGLPGRSANAAIEKLIADTSKAQVAMIIRVYLRSAPDQQRALKQSVEQADLQSLEAMLHSLKSSSRVLGGTELAEFAAEGERLARSGDSRAFSLIPAIHEALDAFCEALSTHPCLTQE